MGSKLERDLYAMARFDNAHVMAALEGRLSPDALSAEEQDVWFDQFADAMKDPSEGEQAFYAKRRTLGQGVGLSDTPCF